MRFLFFLFILFLYHNTVFCQKISSKSADEVYNNIVQAIGNSHPRPPDLIIKKQRGPASYYPKYNEIRIDEKLLSICFSFGKDSLNVLSYILGHELAHHYKDHAYTSKYESLDFLDPTIKSFNDNLDRHEKDSVNKLINIQKRIEYETQADLYAGFYAHLAGYDALSVANSFLDKIYSKYNLNESIKGYPTLSERKKIIDKNKFDFNELKNIFNTANICMSMGQYDYAIKLFDYILNEGFTSREIYNNLGLCFVYLALDLDLESKYFNLVLPFKIDLSSRLENNSVSRDIGTKDKAKSYFNIAIKEFKTALKLDPNYNIAKENLYYSELSLSYLNEENETSYNEDEMLEIKGVCQYCIKGQNAALNNKYNKAKSYFKKGSKVCSICNINIDFKNKQTTAKGVSKLTEFDLEILDFNDLSMNCLDISSSKEYLLYKRIKRMRMAIETKSDVNLIYLKDKINRQNSCVSIHEYSTNNNYKNDANIYIGYNYNDILNNHNNYRIIEAGFYKFITLIDFKLTFLIEENKVKKWYYYQRYN